MLEACPARQLWMPDMQPLVALKLDLHKAEAVQRDFVGHYVIDDHVATAATERMMAPQMQALTAMHFRIMASPADRHS